MIKNEIGVRLFGGLGNQLFQYYAGLHFSQLVGSKLFLDTRWVDAGYGHLGSDLRDFRTDSEVRWVTSITDGSLNFKRERLMTIASRELPFIGDKLRLFVPKSNGYVLPNSQKHFREFRGYFQSPEYFIRLIPPQEHLVLREETIEFQQCREFLLARPFISVHIRAGDYLKQTGVYRILSKEYFMRAIESALSSTNISRIVVFSDNLQYAKDLLGPRYDLEFLPEIPLRASEELVLMSLGSALVISNSTFSYWAAFRSGLTKIFAPESWLVKKELPEGFYPTSWNTIPVI